VNDRFNEVLAIVLRHEGGWSNRKTDAGGPTNHGITQATYDTYRTAVNAERSSVKAISRAEVAAIYRVYYWRAAGCRRLAEPLDMVVMDTAVLFGPGWAARRLQGIVGTTVDGMVGPKTAAACAEMSTDEIIDTLLAMREAHHRTRVRKKPNQAEYLDGWMNRIGHLRELTGVEEPHA
jgi:lysozyme family protein